MTQWFSPVLSNNKTDSHDIYLSKMMIWKKCKRVQLWICGCLEILEELFQSISEFAELPGAALIPNSLIEHTK